ncbi:hypothetical protein ACFO3O_04990 [Dokdonia ponticola]|uniref:ImmA/IrrE family metallo-endopeptidase n=1 Tax=Dokdonia ponticola TaxID=2041041 RepID=A0ABV9HUT7_9FLAO
MIEEKNTRTHQLLCEKIIDFLESIRIPVVKETLPKDTFLPGLRLQGGSILMDPAQLQYPGDLLHEAGHIAVTEEALRPLIGTENMDPEWPSSGDEIATILWSFAAARHLELDLHVVFHASGYKNDSEWIIEQFNNHIYTGLPLLEWMSLCTKEEFPLMRKWLR